MGLSDACLQAVLSVDAMNARLWHGRTTKEIVLRVGWAIKISAFRLLMMVSGRAELSAMLILRLLYPSESVEVGLDSVCSSTLCSKPRFHQQDDSTANRICRLLFLFSLFFPQQDESIPISKRPTTVITPREAKLSCACPIHSEF